MFDIQEALLKHSKLIEDKNVQAELSSVTSLNKKLFAHEIDKNTTELFRAMCILSQCNTQIKDNISSHRPILGKPIVFIKKLLWKLVSPQIEKTFSGIQDCFSYLIISHASALSELKDLKESKEVLRSLK